MQVLPFVFSIPHCGVRIPSDLRSDMALEDHEILESVDLGTRELFGHMPARTVIQARWSRLVADLNRNPQQRDTKGVVALTDYQGRRVFKKGCEPTADQIEQRIQRCHHPYNAQLRQALENGGGLALFDCHSLNGIGPADAPDAGKKRKDITLSNNGGPLGRPRAGMGPITCPPDVLQTIADLFMQDGFSVSINAPYTGGYIVRHYAPQLLQAGRFALQIEMNQNLYMQAGRLEPDPGRMAEINRRMTHAFRAIAESMRV